MAQVKRILNQDEFRGFISFITSIKGRVRSISHLVPEVTCAAFITWTLDKPIPRYIQQDDRFQSMFPEVKFFKPRKPLIRDDSFDFRKLSYIDPLVGERELFHSTEYDFSDAEKGTLCYFNGVEAPAVLIAELVQMLDYLVAWLPDNPTFDLRKITPQQVMQKYKEWHEQEMKRLAREAEERRVRMAEEARVKFEERQRQAALIAERGQSMDLKTGLIQGIDYYPVHSVGDFQFVVLNTQAALDHESLHLDHCVHGYLRYIREDHCTVVSLRHKNDLLKPLMTVELQKDSGMRQEQKSYFYVAQASVFQNNEPPKEFMSILNEAVKDWTPATFAPAIKNGQDVPMELVYRVQRSGKRDLPAGDA